MLFWITNLCYVADELNSNFTATSFMWQNNSILYLYN